MQAMRTPLPELIGVYRFLSMTQSVLAQPFDGFRVEPLPQARDNNGKHWRGMRAWIVFPNGTKRYIHTGLVYLPETRSGIYTELDRGSNPGDDYDRIFNSVQPSDAYDLCKDEANYLKFFYPDAKMAELMAADSEKQAALWKAYFTASILAMR